MARFEDVAGARSLEDAADTAVAMLGAGAGVWRTVADERELLAGSEDAVTVVTAIVTGVCRAVYEVAADAEPHVVEATAALLAEVGDRLEIERRARLARRRLADSERIGAIGTFTWTAADDELDWSDGLTRLYGHEPGDFAPSYTNFLEQVHPDDRQRVRDLHEQAMRTGEPFEMEERIVRPDGEVRTLWSLGEVSTDDDGQPLGIVGVCRDVTEQREAEHRVAEADLRSRQALELNDSVIQGLVSLLWQFDDGDTSEARRIAESTLASARRMVADLLEGVDHLDTGKLVRRSRVDIDEEERNDAAGEPSPPPTADDAHLVRIEPDGTDDGARTTTATTVIVADDLPTLRMLMRMRLSRIDDVEVVAEACDGQQAVDLATRLQPDVVVMDLSMPVLDGLQATRRIREVCPATQVIVLSGYPASSMQQEALDAGAASYLEKSGDLEPLCQMLTDLAARVVSGDLGP